MIIPGILETEFVEITKKVKLLENVSDIIQIDIADGDLVDGKTFLEIEMLSEISADATLELHLMVRNPVDYVEKIPANISRLIAQIEGNDVHAFLTKAKEKGFELGLSLNPETAIKQLDPHLPIIDFIQLMGVIPGAQGKPFDQRVISKMKEFKTVHPYRQAQVDGHMNNQTIPQMKNVGTDHFVVGSDIFNSTDPVNKKLELERLVGS